MFLKWNWPGIFWAFLILILCSLPGSEIPEVPFLFDEFDKVVHFILYFVLAALLYRGLVNQNKYKLANQIILFMVFVICAFYGGIIELYQGFFIPERSADFYDFIADVAGCFFGLVVCKKIKLKFLQID
jgi:VanZ family protein